MKKLTLALCAALALIACDEIKGTSTVSQTLNVLDKKGHQVSIKPGTYTTEFKLDQKHRELKIKMKKSSDNGKDVSMVLNTPSDFAMPRENGQFALMANQTGQAFNLEGQIDTSSYDTDTTSGTESCSIPEQEYVCHDVNVCEGEGDNKTCKCHEECGYETVQIPGRQDVTYYDTITTTKINMQFKDSNSAAELAKFFTQNVSSDRTYTYVGECIRD